MCKFKKDNIVIYCCCRLFNMNSNRNTHGKQKSDTSATCNKPHPENINFEIRLEL